MIKDIVYEREIPRPSNSRYQRILFMLLKVFFINRYALILLKKSYNLPSSTTINFDFKCTAPLLQLDENVCLADTFIVAWAPITIAAGTTFSYRNSIINSTHDYNNFYNVIGKPIIIGENSWITCNCTILGGVEIGSNTIIGAGSVVTQNIPSGVLAAGNPCKVIKKINFKKTH